MEIWDRLFLQSPVGLPVQGRKEFIVNMPKVTEAGEQITVLKVKQVHTLNTSSDMTGVPQGFLQSCEIGFISLLHADN